MRFQRRKRRVEIQRQTFQRHGLGGESPDWEVIFRGWAAIEPKSQRELESGLQTVGVATHKILMRWSRIMHDVDTSMRIVSGSEVYHIVSGPLNLGGGNQDAQFFCERITNPDYAY